MNANADVLFLQKILIDNHFAIDDKTQQAFVHYLQLMQRWNKVFNLTAITEMQEMMVLHILDSLLISRYLHGNHIIDVGTGAGLPGIPLALIQPDKKFYLLDSNNKKINFLTQVKAELSIPNIEIIHSRVEDFHPGICFDSILTRAFTTLKEMLTKTTHLIAEEGQFLAMKGVYPEREIQEIVDNYQVIAVHKLKIIGWDLERHIVLICRVNSEEPSQNSP